MRSSCKITRTAPLAFEMYQVSAFELLGVHNIIEVMSFSGLITAPAGAATLVKKGVNGVCNEINTSGNGALLICSKATESKTSVNEQWWIKLTKRTRDINVISLSGQISILFKTVPRNRYAMFKEFFCQIAASKLLFSLTSRLSSS